MVDTISMRRTHYEVLGLTPAATDEDVERAFAREFGCFRPHTVGNLAQITVAHETLRNPTKRRAYDAEIGLKPQTPANETLAAWQVGGRVMTATATPAMRTSIERQVVEPQLEPAPTLSTAPETKAFIAARLDELASPEPLRERLEARARPLPDPPRPPDPQPKTFQSVAPRQVYLAVDDGADGPEAGAIPWKRAGVIVGALAAAVALLGAWAGWESVSSAEPAENSAKVALPPPTTYTVGDPAPVTPNRVLDVAGGDLKQQRRPVRVAPRNVPARSSDRRLRPALAQAEPATDPLAPKTDAPVDVAQAPSAIAPNLPLPNQVIARTIERIGYRCGDIASATTSGAAGAFTVTCTSGHSYRASPVRGRYHFRRLGSG